MKKTKLLTSLSLLKSHDACSDGLETLIKSLPRGFEEDKEINLLHILTSNGLDHFFWAWRATSKPEKRVKRLILADIIELVEPIYLKSYPASKMFKQVLRALRTGRRVEEAKEADAAAYAAARAAYAAASYAAADAASYAVTRSKIKDKQIKIIKRYLGE